MGEVTPCIAIFRVVFTDGCPLALGDVRTPFLPVLLAFAIVLETLLLLAKVLVVVDYDHGGGRWWSGVQVRGRRQEVCDMDVC